MLNRTTPAASLSAPTGPAARGPAATVCTLAPAVAQAFAHRCGALLGLPTPVPLALIDGLRFPGDGAPVAARPDADYSRPLLETADGVLVFNAGTCAGEPAYEFLAPAGGGTWASYYTTTAPHALARRATSAVH